MWHDQKSTYRTYVSISPIYHQQNMDNTDTTNIDSLYIAIDPNFKYLQFKMKEKIRKEKRRNKKM